MRTAGAPACAAGANPLTPGPVLPALLAPEVPAETGVPLIIAFHPGPVTEWLTRIPVRNQLLHYCWYAPPVILSAAALPRMATAVG